MKTDITLTPENADRIAKYSESVGWTEDELANMLLAETLELFAEYGSGSLEGFLGRIYYRDRASAERALARVTQIVRRQLNGKLPDSYHAEVCELPDGRFDLTAELIGERGELQYIC
jgi:hypothetical protein